MENVAAKYSIYNNTYIYIVTLKNIFWKKKKKKEENMSTLKYYIVLIIEIIRKSNIIKV